MKFRICESPRSWYPSNPKLGRSAAWNSEAGRPTLAGVNLPSAGEICDSFQRPDSTRTFTTQVEVGVKVLNVLVESGRWDEAQNSPAPSAARSSGPIPQERSPPRSKWE